MIQELNNTPSKILIVDDEETVLQSLELVLSQDGYEVCTTKNSLDVLSILQTQSFDLIISDIIMKEMSGLDLTKLIKSKFPLIPIVLITGNPCLSSAQEALRQEAFDYIQKPIDRSNILEVVRRAVQSKKRMDMEVKKYEVNRYNAETLTRKNDDLNIQNSVILDATKDFVITALHDGTIYYLNKSAKIRFEKESNSLVGMNIDNLFPIAKRKRYQRLFTSIQRFKRYSSTHRIELVLMDKFGRNITTEVSICNYTIDGRDYYTGIFRDNSEKKRLIQKLVESEKLEFLNIVSASIGHEINNALTVIMGYIDLATQPDSSLDKKDLAIQVTKNQTEKLHNLASNLISVGRSKMNWLDTKENISELNTILNQVLTVFGASQRIKNCKFHLSLNPNPLLVFGSSDNIELVISNIILNAADASNNQGEIHIRTYLLAGSPSIMVRDNGIGMSDDVLSQIFNPYFTTKEVGKGTGLGLFVVKEISHLYGIKITIESKPNEGSTFILQFKNANKN